MLKLGIYPSDKLSVYTYHKQNLGGSSLSASLVKCSAMSVCYPSIIAICRPLTGSMIARAASIRPWHCLGGEVYRWLTIAPLFMYSLSKVASALRQYFDLLTFRWGVEGLFGEEAILTYPKDRLIWQEDLFWSDILLTKRAFPLLSTSL